jgi:hypothetical protein
MWWHTRRNQISSFDETDESVSTGGGVSLVDYWQASCAHRPTGFVLLVQACVLQSCDAYWLPTPFSCFPFTSPPVRHRVPSHFKRSLPFFISNGLFLLFLCAFAKSQKVTVRFAMSVRLSVWNNSAPTRGLSWNLISEYISEVSRGHSSFIKIGQQ